MRPPAMVAPKQLDPTGSPVRVFFLLALTAALAAAAAALALAAAALAAAGALAALAFTAHGYTSLPFYAL